MSGGNRNSQQWFTPQCSTGKRGYASRKDAKAARVLTPKGDSKLSAYNCLDCGFWHLGHLPPHVTRGYGERP